VLAVDEVIAEPDDRDRGHLDHRPGRGEPGKHPRDLDVVGERHDHLVDQPVGAGRRERTSIRKPWGLVAMKNRA
jgi:hypothetical protein